MNLVELKNILKEINEPNEFQLQAKDLNHPLYWIYSIPKVRIKTLNPQLNKFRLPEARFDVFINGLFINPIDFLVESGYNNEFVIKFIRRRFPELDRFNNPYVLENTDEIKIKGDLESY